MEKANKSLEAALADMEAKKAEQAQWKRDHAPELEAATAKSIALEKRLAALSQPERRAVLDAAGLTNVSAAPPPGKPVSGSGYRAPMKPPELPPIDWQFWRHMPETKQWEACALSLNINPDNMAHHPQGWMAGPGSGPMFTAASFPSGPVQSEFDKRLRLLGASLFKSPHFTAVNNLVMGDRHLATLQLSEFAAWALSVELVIPPELNAMAAIAQARKAAEPEAVPVVLSSETKEQRQDRRLAACETARLTMKGARLPDGVGRLADTEGVTRQAFSADVKSALKRRDSAKREGVIVRSG